jgi:hypothetical protein
MKDIQGFKVSFEKSEFAAFGDGERKIIYVFGGISNRLKLLWTQSVGYWATAKDKTRSEHARNAALCGIVESLILLAGELKEAHESIRQCYYGTHVSRSIQAKLPSNVQDALKRLSKYYEGDNLATYLRDRFANHNDSNEVLKIANGLDHEADHTFYWFPHDNKYFEYATKARLAAIAMYLTLDEWDWETVIAKMVKIVVTEVYPDVHAALNGVLSELLGQMELQRESIIEQGVRNWHELSGEYYVAPE